ncbi:phage major tail protein, TP901-1 family [Kordiimonas marina]|uniref:phage major tail protein, TP901-1 family n=1 Tax=Kordiimonas marina TaxID=2872312 RepID=UPI001FF4D986|nr:phage major tail protein, TP901-1 family [Kordiimonas marina]MCJ9428693.1 phage major tail protein, TP901-1 family [Kordiimonas marina]
MTAQKGRDLILQIDDGTNNYLTVAGFRSNGFTINNTPVDISNKDTGAFQQYMEDAGLRHITVTGDGVFLGDTQFALAHGHAMAGTNPLCKLIAPGLGEYTGAFAIQSLQMTGQHNGEVTYHISLTSAGDITFVAAV